MPGYSVQIADLGLRFEDALAMGLGTETFTRKKALDKRIAAALTERERRAFGGRPIVDDDGKTSWICQRVELNAMTTPQLIAYIEHGLAESGATGKVIPPQETLQQETKQLAESSLSVIAKEEILARLIDVDALIERFLQSDLARGLIDDAVADVSHDEVANALSRFPELPWGEVVQDRANGAMHAAHQESDAITAWIEMAMAESAA